MRTVEARTRTVGFEIERVLRDRHFGIRRVESFRCGVNKSTVCVIDAGTETSAQTFIQTHLQSIIIRAGEIAAQANDAACRVNARARTGTRSAGASRPRIAVNRLKQTSSAGVDVTDFEHQVAG